MKLLCIHLSLLPWEHLQLSFLAVSWCEPKFCFVCILTMLLFPPQLALGAAYGTAKSGTGIAAMAVMRPDLVIKSVIPVVMAGIIAIYGLVVAVLIANGCEYFFC